MDGYSYYNIFDTKGMEYLIVIGFLLMLIPFWLILNRSVKMGEKLNRLWGVLSPDGLGVPQGLYFSKNHTWAYLQKSGIAKVGLDALLLHITGNISLKYYINAGDSIKRGDKLAEISHNGKTLSIFSPISGIIIKPNNSLQEDLEALYSDPYDKGWMFQIKPSQWKMEAQYCYLAEEASAWIKNEVVRYKDFLFMNINNSSADVLPIVMQDGGELTESSLSEMPDVLWQDFQKEFLSL
ncbi:MAG: glycine cleavage system protein H [Bacteroidales bacterium]|jgi:glycine cleavage system H protein|nr:glycine cleavage system protein H [Bacteroidales bacterium]